MANIQIGKYKRPGIFIEEYDNSIITTPTVPGGINTLVIGSSKKGPVNTPILLQNINDFTTIFGDIDRNLERKGSYFHRTVQKMLASGPVYAMNLLSTSDILDLVEYQTLSTATNKANDVERTGPYRKIFNTSGFWKRDTDSFINLTKSDQGNADRLLSFTNLSDKYVTLFIVKSGLKGFDRTMLQWYGTADKVPAYVNSLDYASDYLVDVLVVSGDWSNYQQLSVDATWSKYFNSKGLIKGQIYNFANNRNVNLLSFYEGLSLIPYFRDSSGRNIFIETTINRDTDKTGIFCYFDSDKFELDYPTGLVDLTGNNLVVSDALVDNGQTTINFLSYNETITESISFVATPLDIAGGTTGQNVVALGASVSLARTVYGDSNRTAFYSEGFINGVIATQSVLTGTSSLVVGFATNLTALGSTATAPYAVINGTNLLINSGSASTFTFSIPASNYTLSAITASYNATFYIDGSTGNISEQHSVVDGVLPSLNINDLALGNVQFLIQNGSIVQTPSYKVSGYTYSTVGVTFSVGTGSSVILGTSVSGVPTSNPLTLATASTNYVYLTSGNSLTASVTATSSTSRILLYTVTTGTNSVIAATANSLPNNNPVYTNLMVNATGYNELVPGTDYTVTDLSNGKINVTFLNTANVDITTNYASHRKIRLFNFLLNMLDSPNLSKMTMLKDLVTFEKLSLANASVSNIVTATTSNKSFTLSLGVTTTPSDIAAGNLIFYKLDNEFVLGTNGVNTRSTIGTASYGVVSQYSDFYTDFYNGSINSGDYIYHNLTGVSSRVVFQNAGGEGYIVFNKIPYSSVGQNETIIVPDSVLNSGSYQLLGTHNWISLLTDPATGASYSGGYYAYLLNTTVYTEDLSNVSTIYDAVNKIYLQMYFDSGNNLNVKFVDSELSSIMPIDVDLDSTFKVVSDKSNYKQTIEIQDSPGYTPSVNKILVNGSRYTEVKIGDFLEAYVDPTVTLRVNEVPRNLTRIISKKMYAADTSLVEITCDAAINKYPIATGNGSSYQTLRYTTIDNYVSTYKAITLQGFKIREASLPDGSETKQNAILNLISVGTPLYKALSNKQAIDFRYLIDAYGLGLTSNSKQQLVDLCGNRKDCLGFINVPSMKSFRKSTSPSFVNADGVLQTSFIAAGGDSDSSPAFLYSLADGDGASCVGYFLPYVSVNDNGRPVEVPPAMFAATTYMVKHNSNASIITPWTVAAGITNGRITGIASLETDFDLSDIENLNGAQLNPIVYKNKRGFVIETENTAQTLYKSALSYLHVREVLIELERELSAMLLDFQWKFNTGDVRAEIKLRADTICEKYVSKNGLYTYFNKCDEENNTNELIDNQIGIIETFVEVTRAMGVLVNQVTIERTGSINSSGFNPQ